MTYKTIELSGDDIVAFESILLDARARYVTDRNSVGKLQGAYSQREAIVERYESAQKKIDTINRLLELIR